MTKEFFCPKCGNKISTKKKDVSQGYFGACLKCDEDFYKFELVRPIKKEKFYNVYIISHAGEVQALIGSNMSENRADKRVLSGLTRVDLNNFFIGSYEVGSDTDFKLKKQLDIKNN